MESQVQGPDLQKNQVKIMTLGISEPGLLLEQKKSHLETGLYLKPEGRARKVDECRKEASCSQDEESEEERETVPALKKLDEKGA